MKHCINCQYHERTAMPLNNGQMGMMDVCVNEDCSNPVDGSVFPCGMLRSNQEFCGIKGRHFKLKEVEKPQPEGNVIQLT